MNIAELESVLDTADVFEVSYRTIGLGNGSDDDQEEDTLTLRFDGCSDNAGRTIRYHFQDTSNGEMIYLFADEILSVIPE